MIQCVPVPALKAFEELMKVKETRLSKLDNLEYTELKMQNYLKSSNINSNQVKSLFKFRTRMATVAVNFPNMYVDLSCPLCKSSSDTQEHILQCSKLLDEVPELKSNSKVLYKHIFSNNIEKMKDTVLLLDLAMKKREEILTS